METQTVTAYPVVHDVPALNAFLGSILGPTGKLRAIGSAGGYHTEVEIGDSVLMIGGGGPNVAWKGEARPMAFHIYVPDTYATSHPYKHPPTRTGANAPPTSKTHGATAGTSRRSKARTTSPKARPPSSLFCSRSVPNLLSHF